MTKEVWRRDDGWEIVVDRVTETQWIATYIPLVNRKVITYDDLALALRAHGYGREE